MQLADVELSPARDEVTAHTDANLDGIKLAQRSWAMSPMRARIAIIRQLRRRIAADPIALAKSVPLHLPGALSRNLADTLVAEVLPLLEACRFLEREGEAILRTRHLGSEGRPMWLGNVQSRVERAPWGIVLILGASNYPLFLAGVQTLQALVAGNAVMWKPAPGTEPIVRALKNLLVEAGLEAELLTILDSEVSSAAAAIEAGVDHVVLTGSVETGKAVMRQLAETLTAATMELSGSDVVFVLPSADLLSVVDAVAFGLRLNGSFTCMAPRRVFLIGLDDAQASKFENRLQSVLRELPPVPIPAKTRALLEELTEDARRQGARIALDGLSRNEKGIVQYDPGNVGPTLILGATPAAKAMRTEIFAPLVTLIRVTGIGEALAANAACPYALTASIFGDEQEAKGLGSNVHAGNLLINDIITSTVDPRIPFGGRGRSGFGVTRGAEGLLAMTTPKTIQTKPLRRGANRAFQPTGDNHVAFFTGLIQMLHGNGISIRFVGLKHLIAAGKKLK